MLLSPSNPNALKSFSKESLSSLSSSEDFNIPGILTNICFIGLTKAHENLYQHKDTLRHCQWIEESLIMYIIYVLFKHHTVNPQSVSKVYYVLLLDECDRIGVWGNLCTKCFNNNNNAIVVANIREVKTIDEAGEKR